VRRADRITAAALLAFSLAFAAGALKHYPYWGEGGPGSAFLPAWLGGAMALLALLLLVRRPRQADNLIDWLPRGAALQRLLVVLGATVLYVALLNTLGMIIASALYLAFIMRYLERHAWWLTALVASATAGANWALFEYWLKVPFPMGPFGF
jgi:putative tricarboxylic transport membrane protein